MNSGVFKNNQVGWDMCCKEAYPIKECFERHRSLLHGNLPVVSVNDHKNLLYISVDAYRHSTVTQAARHRLARWALFMAEENIRVVHIPGTQNHLADLLSRNGNKEYAAAKRNEQQINTKSPTPSNDKEQIHEPHMEATKTGWPELPEGPMTLNQAKAVVLGLTWDEPTQAEKDAVAAAQAKQRQKEAATTSEDSDDSNPGMETETDEEEQRTWPSKSDAEHEHTNKKQQSTETQPDKSAPDKRSREKEMITASHPKGAVIEPASQVKKQAKERAKSNDDKAAHPNKTDATTAANKPMKQSITNMSKSMGPREQNNNEKDHDDIKKQFLIIKPKQPQRVQALQQHEVNLQDKHIMKNRQDISWPTAATIAKAQKQLTAKEKKNAEEKTIEGRRLYINAQGKIIIPATAENLQRTLITLAHQDNHGHRSIEDSIKVLRETFTFPMLKQEADELIHSCLQCLKLRGGKITPRPTWEMMRATVPFEYIHADYMDMPTASTGECYLLIITDDLSGTVLLHPCKTHQAIDTARTIVDEWLSMYPDPTILHTDGGTHFVNSLLKAIADIRGFKHHITAPYNKKSHGVGERINRTCLDAYLAFLGQMELDEKSWPKYAKMIQAQINRTPTKSRGNKSPIEITTGVKPKSTFNHILFEGYDGILQDKLTVASEAIEQHVEKFILIWPASHNPWRYASPPAFSLSPLT